MDGDRVAGPERKSISGKMSKLGRQAGRQSTTAESLSYPLMRNFISNYWCMAIIFLFLLLLHVEFVLMVCSTGWSRLCVMARD